MDKRFWICGLVVSIAAMLLDFLIHGQLLQDDYGALVASGLVRGPAEGPVFVPHMAVAHLLIGYGLTWLYRQASPSSGTTLAHGLRFGAAFSIAATIPGYLVYYAVQPWPPMLVAKQIAFSVIAMLLLGVLLAYLQPRRVVL